MAPENCQADSLETASKRLARPVDLSLRAIELIRREGLTAAFRKIFRFLRGQPPQIIAGSGAPIIAEALDLVPGDWVEVKPLHEIQETLDAEGKLAGLAFLPGMAAFCGRRFRVFKHMRTMYQEESGIVRRMKNTVLLEGVYCDGLLMRCDRSCFYYWRDAWLRRAPESSCK
jgi:hypothetical protein